MSQKKTAVKPLRKPDTLREACVAEALNIIGEVGVEALSIREVARRLGVSHQAPYRHFPSSDHLLAEIVRRTFQMFAEHLEKRPRGSSEPEDLNRMGQAYLRFAMEHPLHYRLMFGSPLPNPDAHPEMMSQAKHAFSILENAVSKIHGLEDSRKGHRLVQLDSLFVWATVHGLATILQTAALDQLGLGREVLSQALPHILLRVGKALQDENL